MLITEIFNRCAFDLHHSIPASTSDAYPLPEPLNALIATIPAPGATPLYTASVDPIIPATCVPCP